MMNGDGDCQTDFLRNEIMRPASSSEVVSPATTALPSRRAASSFPMARPASPLPRSMRSMRCSVAQAVTAGSTASSRNCSLTNGPRWLERFDAHRQV